MTHDQEEALSISDRVAVLSQGRIEQIGSPAEIYGAPGTPFVAEFVGTMNRVQATVEAAVDGAGLTGEVVSHTFLGSVTRLHVAIGAVEWSADLSSEQARALPVGARVRLRFPAASAQLLSLAESGAPPAIDPDDR